MTEDYSAPLGLDRPGAVRRRLPLWPFFAGLTVIVVGGLAGWAMLNPDPFGGQPHVVVDLPPLPPATVAAPEPAAPVDTRPDDPGGQIIISDP